MRVKLSASNLKRSTCCHQMWESHKWQSAWSHAVNIKPSHYANASFRPDFFGSRGVKTTKSFNCAKKQSSWRESRVRGLIKLTEHVANCLPVLYRDEGYRKPLVLGLPQTRGAVTRCTSHICTHTCTHTFCNTQRHLHKCTPCYPHSLTHTHTHTHTHTNTHRVVHTYTRTQTHTHTPCLNWRIAQGNGDSTHVLSHIWSINLESNGER